MTENGPCIPPALAARPRSIRLLQSYLALPLLLLGISCGGGEDGSAGGPAVTLELDASYVEPFSFLNGVRELPDGRVMAADPLSQVLLRVDIDAGTADTLGRLGGGPEEYQQPDRVFPLPGDSTLLVDIGKAYLTVVGPEGDLHGGMSMSMPTEEGLPAIIMPSALDAEGRIYFQGMGMLGQGPPDSVFILRYDRRTTVVDTAATIWRPAPNIQRSSGNVRVMGTMLEGRDDWALGPDGRVGVVRAEGYSVDWFLPDGSEVSGPDTPFESYPVSQEDKERVLEERNAGGGLVMAITSSSSGGGSIMMSRGGMRMGGGDDPSVDDFQWAEEFPAFQPDRSVVSLENELWVQRYVPVGQPPVMDVFGPDGIRTGSVQIPEASRLLGFGHGPRGGEVAYFVRTDEVGLMWLERYRVVR
jgi:hypothetical protein